jgi:hypothetical protein
MTNFPGLQPERQGSLAPEQSDNPHKRSPSRRKALWQVWIGLAWWIATSIAVAASLGTSAGSVLWFGGIFFAIFYWYRARKIYRANFQVGIANFSLTDIGSVIFSVAIVLVSAVYVLPQYFLVANPGIGTCLSQNNSEGNKPVPCWSSSAKFKIIGYANSGITCTEQWFMNPSSTESRFTCLIKTP